MLSSGKGHPEIFVVAPRLIFVEHFTIELGWIPQSIDFYNVILFHWIASDGHLQHDRVMRVLLPLEDVDGKLAYVGHRVHVRWEFHER